MKFGPLEVKDKTGRTITLRNADISDAPALIHYMKATTAETPYLVREPDEFNMTVEQEERFIESLLDSERELMLIATTGTEHIGNCSLMSIGNYRR